MAAVSILAIRRWLGLGSVLLLAVSLPAIAQ